MLVIGVGCKDKNAACTAYQSKVDVFHVFGRIIIFDLASCPVLSFHSKDLTFLDGVTLHVFCKLVAEAFLPR